MGTLGDWLAMDAITVAMVWEGDRTLEDLGIMALEPGEHVIICRDVRPMGTDTKEEQDGTQD